MFAFTWACPARLRSTQPKCCVEASPKARRLSLPTWRERQYLTDLHIERSNGRSSKYFHSESFRLMIWPLIVTKPQDDRFARAFAEFQKTEQSEPNQFEMGSDAIEQDTICTETRTDDDVPISSIEKNLSLVSSEVDSPDEEQLSEEIQFRIPPWAYIVRVRASKVSLGKRAVQRNRAKRRIRAAAAKIMPDHATREREYIFSALPESLLTPLPALEDEIKNSLRSTNCWEEHMTIEMLRREKYCRR